MSRHFPASELILNDRGAIYHLDLRPNEIANTIITVGDPRRVKKVSQYFDTIEIKRKKREFKTHTGTLKGKRITVISTGIGTDNIDIVMNELDALANIDFKTRKEKKAFTQLDIIRIGTSGALQDNILVDSLVANRAAIGIDALGMFYGERDLDLEKQLGEKALVPLYTVEADPDLFEKFGPRMIHGNAITAGGFYAPQGRSIRHRIDHEGFIEALCNYEHLGYSTTNMEMETAGIYLLAKKLGHRAISCNAILANRVTKEFSKSPGETIDRLIRKVLQEL